MKKPRRTGPRKLGEKHIGRPPALRKAIYDTLVAAGRPLTSRELADSVDREIHILRESLEALVNQGVVTPLLPREQGRMTTFGVLAPFVEETSELGPRDLKKVAQAVEVTSRFAAEEGRRAYALARSARMNLARIHKQLKETEGGERVGA